MVRCGAVKHPNDWPWSGYGELMGGRRRNRLLDLDKLLWLLRAGSVEEFRLTLQTALEEAMAKDQLKREPTWTECLAVGSQGYVEKIESEARNRQRLQCEQEGGVWVLRDEHGPLYGAKNEPISLPGGRYFS